MEKKKYLIIEKDKISAVIASKESVVLNYVADKIIDTVSSFGWHRLSDTIRAAVVTKGNFFYESAQGDNYKKISIDATDSSEIKVEIWCCNNYLTNKCNGFFVYKWDVLKIGNDNYIPAQVLEEDF